MITVFRLAGRKPNETEHMAATSDGGSHLLSLVRSTVPPMHPGGRPIVLSAAAAALGSRLLLRRVGLRRVGRSVGRLGLIGAAASAVFFREPKRVPPTRSGLVVAPADGIVSLIEQAEPPAELGLEPGPRTRISIFLSLFDVHVQRVPVSGRIRTIAYRPGKFLSADLDKASTDNERNSLHIVTDTGAEVIVTQIAGLVARRIVCDVHEGDAVAIGSTYGLIRFGSRLDTYLPAGAEVRVAVGQRAVGAETVLAALPVTAG